VIAVVSAREGELALGSLEAVAECGGRAIVVGSGTEAAADELVGVAFHVRTWERASFEPGTWATGLAEVLQHEPIVVLPASPDGRDLAPRLAAALGRPLVANAVAVHREGATVTRYGGLALEDIHTSGPFVATLHPGARGVEREPGVPLAIVDVDPEPSLAHVPPDGDVLGVLAPDIATMDLTEAPRIVTAGAGLDGPERVAQLARVATGLAAALGATRVVTDRGWAGHERQIGTTGVVVDPRLYIAFAVSGAVQHTSGLGQPDHVISVNVDPHCPMMAIADLAIVSDANAVIDALERRLARPEGAEVIAFPQPAGVARG
jgi:electron transfer flavoprotein alpha subunit